jgi:hypothetical protein
MRRVFVFGLGFCLWLLVAPSVAAPSTEDIPEVLRPWIPWVLHGHEESFCPAVYNDARRRLCAWPARLELALTDTGGRFAQSWRVYKEGWVPLPGNTDHWPDDLEVDAAAVVVTDRDGVPHVRLTPGEHRVTGDFTWSRLPKSLRITEAVGLIELTVNGRTETFPQLDERSELWLRDRRPATGEERAERLRVRAFRRVEDDLPMRLTTRLQIDVSGTPREVVLGPTMPDGAIPLALDSALPTRLEPDGRLRLQLRPGSWAVTLVVRFPGSVDRLTRPAADAPWPPDEVWWRSRASSRSSRGAPPCRPNGSGFRPTASAPTMPSRSPPGGAAIPIRRRTSSSSVGPCGSISTAVATPCATRFAAK